MCVLAYWCLHGTAPAYVAESLQLLSTIEGRRLRSTDTMDLLIPVTRCRTLGNHSFHVAAAWAWKTLPSSVWLSSSCNTFHRRQHWTVSSVIPCLIVLFDCDCFVKYPSNSIAIMWHYNLNIWLKSSNFIIVQPIEKAQQSDRFKYMCVLNEPCEIQLINEAIQTNYNTEKLLKQTLTLAPICLCLSKSTVWVKNTHDTNKTI